MKGRLKIGIPTADDFLAKKYFFEIGVKRFCFKNINKNYC